MIFCLWAGLCLACFVIRTAFNVMDQRGHPLAGKKAVVNSVYAVMGVLWFSWFQMCFSDPARMEPPDWIRYAGPALFASGVALFLLSHLKLRRGGASGALVTGGVYARIRNPMYLGFILWMVGFPVFTRSLATMASAAVWSAFILYWKALEERTLEGKCQGYAEYKKRTWF
jgi:protein-S-isoprenylcysteine O-methyltransferase Ste14